MSMCFHLNFLQKNIRMQIVVHKLSCEMPFRCNLKGLKKPRYSSGKYPEISPYTCRSFRGSLAARSFQSLHLLVHRSWCWSYVCRWINRNQVGINLRFLNRRIINFGLITLRFISLELISLWIVSFYLFNLNNNFNHIFEKECMSILFYSTFSSTLAFGVFCFVIFFSFSWTFLSFSTFSFTSIISISSSSIAAVSVFCKHLMD